MKKQIISFLTAAAALFIIAVPSVGATTDKRVTPSEIPYTDIGSQIDGYVKEHEKELASVEVSVFCGEDTLYSGCYGYADIERKVKADEETVYDWGSCSKLLVWTSIMQLSEDGKIDTDADIREYLPKDFFKKLQYPDEKITVNNLMSHNAGWQETAFEDQTCGEDDLDTLENILHKTEPYQAYHVGEHTAYSNWGAALGAFIVERVSGMDYAEYVYKNIFEPIGMKDTAVSLAQSQDKNFSSMLKRRQNLNTYYFNGKTNQNYGANISWVQLYPAGSTVSTINDFSLFAKAFTSKKCPLFKNESTREQMFSATTYFGDSDIPKNCHGMWTSEYAAECMGHSGNTAGCSSTFLFDPESGLGVVLMTNKSGETDFNSGIPQLLFGECEKNKKTGGSITDTSDISGIYTFARGYKNGYVRIKSLMGGFMPVTAGEDTNNYNIPLTDMKVKRIADNQWIATEGNSASTFIYESKDQNGKTMFEMMSSDLVKDDLFLYELASLALFLIITVFSVLCLIIKLISKKLRQKSSVSIALIQASFIIITGITVALIMFLHPTRQIAAVCCCAIAVFALLAAINAVCLIFNTITRKSQTVIRNIFWSLFGMFAAAFVVYFQLFNFWNC